MDIQGPRSSSSSGSHLLIPLLLAILFHLFFFPDPLLASEGSWLIDARVAGLGLSETISDRDLEARLEQFVVEGVNVVEADSSLSDYLTEEQFDMELAFIRKVARMAHEKGLKVVWYYPSLEVITADGRIQEKSMKRDHPDWVQRNFDRKGFNYFYGTKVFWVEPNDESAWMCPNSPYRDYFYKRVEQLAGTGIDGLWLDVPLFNSIAGKWPCADPYCIRKFGEETGMTFPSLFDFSNPAFRRWILWRHKTLADFLKGALQVTRKVNRDFKCVIEVVSVDHLINTLEGLDVTYFDPDLDLVWEVDAISDTSGMRDASPADWMCAFMAYKYCSGIARNRARWAFYYGSEDADAQLVMASLVAAQCNPYETKIPEMASSVGRDFRKKMFQWIKSHSDLLFTSHSLSEVAILYSPQTRDFVDGTRYGGFYVSQAPPAPDVRWWVKSPDQSVLHTRYLSEYRGWGFFLIDCHIPFDILDLNQIQESDLPGYKALILPGAVALPEKETSLLLKFVSEGGTLIVTGRDAGSLDQWGNKRNVSLWKALQGHDRNEVSYGKGVIFFDEDLPGAERLKGNDKEIRSRYAAALERRGVHPLVSGEAAPAYVQSYKQKNYLAVHLLNYGWVGKKKLDPTPITVQVSLPLPEGKAVKRVTLSSPDGAPDREVPFTQTAGSVQFSAETRINTLAIIETEP